MVNNHITLIGRIATDLELRAYSSDQKGEAIPCTSFRLAVSRIHDPDHADFFTVSVFGIQAKNLCAYQHKGSLIAVDGSLRQNIWKDAQGKVHYDVEIRADSIQYLDRRGTDDPNLGYVEEPLDGDAAAELDRLFDADAGRTMGELVGE